MIESMELTGSKSARWRVCLLGMALQILFFSVGFAGELEDEIANKELIVRTIANRAKSLYVSRCSKLPSCPEQCTNWACSNAFKWSDSKTIEGDDVPLQCSRELGSTEECGKDNGQLLDFESSFMRYAPDTNPSSKQLKESTCAFKDLDDTFVSNRENYEHDIWQYFGHVDGSYRVYPGTAREHEGDTIPDISRTCRKYDPRLRPWFISAATGPKDIILLIDTSGSMIEPASATTGESRIDVLRNALLQLLDTFTFTDFISIVRFSSDASVLQSKTKLVRATEENILALKREVRVLGTGGGTDFSVGFNKVFDLFEASLNDAGNSDSASSSGCEKIVLFLTDGDNRGAEPHALIETRQAALQNHVNCGGGERCRASIFTFSMGSGVTAAGESDLKRIACSHKGVWISIFAGEGKTPNPMSPLPP